MGEVRKRGVFVIEALLWASTGGLVMVLVGYFVLLLNFFVSGAEHFRRILGANAPSSGPDWYALLVIGLAILVPVSAFSAVFSWYNSVWRNRLKSTWRHADHSKRFSKIQPVPKIAGVGDREERTEYLRRLLDGDNWRPYWQKIKEDAGIGDTFPDTLSPERYERAATAVWKTIQADVKDRALTTGLIVGLSKNRWMDQVTILVASLELQLHVLTRLGKQPTWRTWRILLKRMLSSLFINTYLTREDAFLVQFIIKKTAMGLYVLSDLAEHGADHLKDVDVDHLIHALDVDEALEGSRHVAEQSGGVLKAVGGAAGKFADVAIGVPGLGTVIAETLTTAVGGGVKVGLTVTEFSLKTGATGLHLLGTFTDHYGQELMQGVAASVMLYSHGAELAADCLALDASHRTQMDPGYKEILTEMAKHAGGILFDQVKQLRDLFSQRRKQPINLVTTYLKRQPHPSKTKEESQVGSDTTKND